MYNIRTAIHWPKYKYSENVYEVREFCIRRELSLIHYRVINNIPGIFQGLSRDHRIERTRVTIHFHGTEPDGT